MLSKLMRGEGAVAAERISWMELQDPAPPPGEEAQAEPEPEPEPEPELPPPPDPLLEEAGRLRARVAELEALLERRVRESHQAGFREGETAGRKQGVAEVQPVIERLAQSIRELAQYRDIFRRNSEPDLIKLSVAIAERILRRQLSVDPEAIGGLLKAGFEKLRRQESCRVRMHPDHKTAVQRWLEQRGPECPIELIADSALPAGGIVIETAGGDLDASAGTQLSEIEAGLVDVLRRRS